MAAVTICSDLEPQKIKSATVSTVSPSICHEEMGLDAMILVFWMLSFSQLFHSPLSPSILGHKDPGCLFVSSGPATSVHAFLCIMVGEKRVRALPTDSWMLQPRSASCSWPIAQIPSHGMGAHGWTVNSTCLIQGVFSILRKWCKLTASDSVKIQALSMSLFFKSACLMKHI